MGRIKNGLSRFMQGRYGTDKLNTVMLWTGVICCIVAFIASIWSAWANFILIIVAYTCLFRALFRCMSRNTHKRYQENRRFLLRLEKIRDREHKYFRCPHCRQDVRVPKKKGKISISCPKCREKFIRKT